MSFKKKLFADNRFLFFILALGFLLRLVAVLLVPEYFLFPDSKDYHLMAHNYLQGNDFTLFGTLYAVRPPLYSFFLAVLYFVGFGPFSVLMMQTFLGTGMILCQYFLCMLFFPKKAVALFSSLLLALDPFFILFGALLLTEILFSFLFLCLIFCFMKMRSSNRQIPWLYAGFLFGLGCLCRDALLGFFVFAFFFIGPSSRLKKAFLFLLGAFLVIFPWTLRNWLYFQKVVIITSKKGINLYEAFGPGATGGCSILEMNLPEASKRMQEAQQDTFLTKWVISYILKNPQKALELSFVKWKRFWNIGLNYEALKKHPINKIVIFFNAFLYFFAIVGFCYAEKKKILLLFTPVIYFTILHGIFLGSVRYRVPIMPYLEILAAYGIFYLGEKIAKKS